MALWQTSRQYDLLQSVVFAFGVGLGFCLALIIMAGLREELELSDVPSIVDGAALTLIVAGILSCRLYGFWWPGRIALGHCDDWKKQCQ